MTSLTLPMTGDGYSKLLPTMTMIVALLAWPAQGDTITVDTTDGSGASDGNCSLPEAMEAAETDTAFGDCPAGNGWDRILFTVTGTIAPTTDLPAVEESLSFVGPGADSLTIDGQDLVKLFSLGALDGLESFLFSGLTITRGASNTSGGAIAVARRNWLTVTECEITDSNSPSGGGAIYLANNTSTTGVWTSLLIERSQISGNEAEGSSGGGGVRVGLRNHALVVDSTLSDNSATHVNGDGGGINAFFGTGGGSLVVLRSTISGNSSREGGGISFSGPSGTSVLDIAHSTIVDNTATGDGGGIEASRALVIPRNSIIASNSGATGPDIHLAATALVNGADSLLIGDNTDVTADFPSGTPNTDGSYVGDSVNILDPNLGPLADNGGWSDTFLPASASDAVDNGSCAGQLTDQRGYAGGLERTEGAGCDIGAVETSATDLEPIFLSNFDSGSAHRWTRD